MTEALQLVFVTVHGVSFLTICVTAPKDIAVSWLVHVSLAKADVEYQAPIQFPSI